MSALTLDRVGGARALAAEERRLLRAAQLRALELFEPRPHAASRPALPPAPAHLRETTADGEGPRGRRRTVVAGVVRWLP